MSRATPSRLLAALALLVLAAVGVLAPAPAASAHTSLVSSVPGSGETLAVPPSQLVLTFDEELAAVGAELALTGEDGAPVAVTGTVVDGPTVTFTLASDGPPGAYTATWRVVAGDGHPVEGTLSYSAAARVLPVEPTAEPAPEPAPLPTPEGTSAPPATTTAPSTEAASNPVDPLAPATGSAGLAWLVAGLGAVGAAVVVLARRRGGPRRRP